MKYRKKPVIIEAVLWDGELATYHKLQDMGMPAQASRSSDNKVYALQIKTLEGFLQASVGDWIIKGIKGEFYPCKPYIFEATYELVSNE